MKKQPDGMEPAFAARFLAIQKTFVAGLPQRMTAILRADEASARYTALHQLEGAAGCFGFSALSVMAREVMSAQQLNADLPLHAALQRLALAIAEIRLAS